MTLLGFRTVRFFHDCVLPYERRGRERPLAPPYALPVDFLGYLRVERVR